MKNAKRPSDPAGDRHAYAGWRLREGIRPTNGCIGGCKTHSSGTPSGKRRGTATVDSLEARFVWTFDAQILQEGVASARFAGFNAK